MREKSKFPKKAICLRINEKHLEKLDKIAEEKGMDKNELMRRIIEKYINNYEL